SGSIGAVRLRSTRKKATSATTPMTSADSTAGAPQPREGASVKKNTTPPNPAVASTAPPTSSGPADFARGLSGTRAHVIANTITATGRLTAKAQAQDSRSIK